MNEQQKPPFPPTTRKRYEISEDPFSRDRIYGLYKTIRALKSEFPFIAGLTVHGSLIKNKGLLSFTAGDTDIDTNLFIDVDRLKESQEALLGNPEYTQTLQFVYKDLQEDGIEQLTEEEIQFRAASEFISNKFREDFQNQARIRPEETSELIITRVRKIALEGPYSLQEQEFTTYPRPAPDEAETNGVKQHLSRVAAPWVLDVGGGLKPYRQRFLEELAQRDIQEAERMWQYVRGISIKWERNDWEKNVPVPQEIRAQYPTAFREALRYYSPHR